MKEWTRWVCVKYVSIPAMLTFILLTGCGGGGNPGSRSGSIDSVPPAITSPGGLYVGYFHEDAFGNPEDPESGAFVLQLPAKDGVLSGTMNFTYVDCQSKNTAVIIGSKSAVSLSGTWTADIDSSPQSGAFSGTYLSAATHYEGGFTNDNGKQFKNLPGCLIHSLAANGNWVAFSVEQNQPATFTLAVTGLSVAWSASTGTASTLIYVLDSTARLSSVNNSVVFQRLLPYAITSYNLNAAGLVRGKEYIVGVLLRNASSARIAFGSKRFIAG